MESRLEGGNAGGIQWAGMALASRELHRTVMSTPGLRALADVACYSVAAGSTMQARFRLAFVHIFLAC